MLICFMFPLKTYLNHQIIKIVLKLNNIMFSCISTCETALYCCLHYSNFNVSLFFVYFKWCNLSSYHLLDNLNGINFVNAITLKQEIVSDLNSPKLILRMWFISSKSDIDVHVEYFQFVKVCHCQSLQLILFFILNCIYYCILICQYTYVFYFIIYIQ